MRHNFLEAVMGGVVLVVAALFLNFAYQHSDSRSDDGYILKAFFNRIDGIKVGSDVKMSGVKIGTVTGISIDPDSYRAALQFTVRSDIKVPNDSSVEVSSESLLGGKYLSLVAGGEDKYLSAGSLINHTQSSMTFESLIAKFFLNQGDDKKSEKKDEHTVRPKDEAKVTASTFKTSPEKKYAFMRTTYNRHVLSPLSANQDSRLYTACLNAYEKKAVFLQSSSEDEEEDDDRLMSDDISSHPFAVNGGQQKDDGMLLINVITQESEPTQSHDQQNRDNNKYSKPQDEHPPKSPENEQQKNTQTQEKSEAKDHIRAKWQYFTPLD